MQKAGIYFCSRFFRRKIFKGLHAVCYFRALPDVRWCQLWAQVGKIVYGASEPERGFINLKTTLHPKTVVVGGVLEKEWCPTFNSFFVEKRNLN